MNEKGEYAITLKHIDLIPQKVGTSNFETIDDLLAIINARLQEPIARQWNLISVESLKVEANSDWAIDSEKSLVEDSSRHLTILRLYYQEYNHANQDAWPMKDVTPVVQMIDFKPCHLGGGSFFKRPQFEPFASLVQRSARWLTSQCSVHFMNAQSIFVKVKSRKLRIEVVN